MFFVFCFLFHHSSLSVFVFVFVFVSVWIKTLLVLSCIQYPGCRLNDFWLKVYQLAVFLQVVKILWGSASLRHCFCIQLPIYLTGLSYTQYFCVRTQPSSKPLPYYLIWKINVAGRCTKTQNKTKPYNENLIKTFIITICVVLRS